MGSEKGAAEVTLNSEDVVYWQPTGPNPLDHRDDQTRPDLRHGRVSSCFSDGLMSTFLAGEWQNDGRVRGRPPPEVTIPNPLE